MKNKLTGLSMLLCCIFILLHACKNPQQIQQARYFVNGKKVYETHCQNCHGAKGEGLAALYPALQSSGFISEFPDQLACIIRDGKNQMPPAPTLTPIEISYLINYIGNYFDNSIGFYSLEQTQADLSNCP